MKFFTNKISTNSNGRFSDLVKKIAESDQQVKTASVKTAEDGLKGDQDKLPEALKNEIREDKGAAKKDDDGDGKVEKTEEGKQAKSKAKVVKAEAGVDDDGEGKRTDVHHGEGSPKDQNGEPEEDGENKTVDPAGLGSSAEVEEEVKIASEEGDSGSKVGTGEGDSGDSQEGVNKGRFPDGFEPKQEAEDEGTADVKASTKKQVKEAGELPEALKEHQFGKKKDSEGNDDADGKDDDAEKEGCSASATSKLERVANLTAPEKNRLKSYFRRYYPESYADALTQDK